MDPKNKSTPLDESLYSRQIYVLGHEAMNKMRESNVLISGLGGVGVELAKCVILGGVKSVTLHDDKTTSLADLATGYYLSETDIGKNRTICSTKLKELNPYVQVDVTTGDLRTVLYSRKFDVVVLTDNTFTELMCINQITRERDMKFISCLAYGGFGCIFCDFGDNFVVNDIDGEEPKSGIVTDLYYTGNDKIIVQTVEPHNLSESNIVSVTGLGELVVQDIEDTRKFIVRYPHTNKEKLVTVSNRGFQQIKYPKVIKFKPFIEGLTDPDFVITDIFDYTRPNTLHAIFQAIDRFCVKNYRLPRIWNDNDAEELYQFTSQIYPEANKNVVNKISQTLQGQLSALSAMIGSIGAQEVIKACSSKFHPIHQWFYYDVISSLPDCKPKDLDVKKDRYYSQRLIFGDDFQDKLNSSKVFVVGSGAIGCEHLKNFAMMGIGNLIVTDMDTIEKSNLNRQFLFRMNDIGKPKSEIAARGIKKINSSINITAHQNKVCAETEMVYDEKFFESLTCVANALDNVQARLYVDDKCITYHKPLLESGTLGTKGNVQTIVPHLTESYGSMKDPVEESVPVCTLKNYPYLIEHCLTGDTLVPLRGGLSIRIDNLSENGGECVFGWSGKGLVNTNYSKLIKQGMRKVNRLVLSDGREITCTPDHKFLTCLNNNFVWECASEIKLNDTQLVMGIEFPFDQIDDDENDWNLIASNGEREIIFDMVNPLNRKRSLAFARLVGATLGDRHIAIEGSDDRDSTSYQVKLFVGHPYDRDIVLDDVELVCGTRPGYSYNGVSYVIVMPIALRYAIVPLLGTPSGNRAKEPVSLPSFITDNRCPKSIVREFLGGHFGAYGYTASLIRRNKYEDISTSLIPVGLSHRVDLEYADSLKEMLETFKSLMEKVGVKNVIILKEQIDEVAKEVDYRLNCPPTDDFTKFIGFRYSMYKSIRLAAATCYWRYTNRIMNQRENLINKIIELINKGWGTRDATYKARMEVFKNENPLHNFSWGIDYNMIYFIKNKIKNNRTFRTNFTRSGIDPLDYFTSIGADKFFTTGYCLPLELDTLPTFLLTVIDRYELQEPHQTYDISVPETESFIANGIVVHNCIQFARDIFEGYFVQGPSNTVKYLTGKDGLKTMTPTEVINIVKDIKQVIKHIPKKYDDCVNYAYEQWHELFRDQILQLRHSSPPDCKTSEGIPFWSGAKKCPTPLTFNPDNELHIRFIESFANLWADVFGLKHETTEVVKRIVNNFKPSVFVLNDEKISDIQTSVSGNEVDQLIIESLPMCQVDNIKQLRFEKDDDTNFHIDFITATSNLRATNYEIKLADRHKTKGIAGNIIPAIATTTSLVSSLVSLELYKIISGHNELEKFRNSFVNLAIPFFGFTEPAPAQQFNIGNKVFTFWDSTKFNDVKLSEIIEYYRSKYDVEVDDITVGQARFYSNFLSTKKRKERLNKTITEIYYEITDTKPTSSPIVLTLMCDGNYDLPTCKIYF